MSKTKEQQVYFRIASDILLARRTLAHVMLASAERKLKYCVRNLGDTDPQDESLGADDIRSCIQTRAHWQDQVETIEKDLFKHGLKTGIKIEYTRSQTP